MARSALILVDLQNDFLPGGALAVAEGDQTVLVANRLMGDFPIVVCTKDWHPPGHQSFASQHEGRSPGEVIELHGLSQVLWPDHCVQGEPGAEFAAALELEGVSEVFVKGTDPEVDSYSGFFDNGRRQDTGMAAWLREQGVDALTVLGLATDYCVKFTALDAVAEGFATTLVLEGCRGVELEAGDVSRAIDEMRAAGVTVVE